MDRERNILAAVGQFPQDDSVLARAAAIARAHRTKLTIVHVIDDFTGYDFVSADMDLGLIQHQVQLISRESVEAGSPSLRVIEPAEKINADLVVMRAHQGNSILEKVIGSTTDRVIRANCAPVLVVKRPVRLVLRHIAMP